MGAGWRDVLAGLRSEDGPLSVRVRPSSLKRDCDRRTTNTGGKCSANAHAKSRLTLGCLCGHSGQKTRARPEPARPDAGHPLQGAGGHDTAAECSNDPGSSKHELSPTPSVSWDSGQPPSGAASSGRRGRARCVPDRPVNTGKLPSLPDSPIHPLTCVPAGRPDAQTNLLTSGS